MTGVRLSDGSQAIEGSEEGGGTSSQLDFLREVIRDHVVVISAQVRVEYMGRASSAANSSQRVVITKPDGTLLIHEDTKHRPLNWQPPGTQFHVSLAKGSVLVLEAFRKKHREVVTVWFEKVNYMAASRLSPGDFRFSGSEAEMVDMVLENPSLIERGFLPRQREFRTKYGSVDLVGVDREGNLMVLEFKRRQAQLAGASQLDRYVRCIIDEVEQRRVPASQRDKPRTPPIAAALRSDGARVRGGLVAPSITKEALALLRERGHEFFEMEPVLRAFVPGERLERENRVISEPALKSE